MLWVVAKSLLHVLLNVRSESSEAKETKLLRGGNGEEESIDKNA